MKVSHFGKMGDLVYALPVLRALHRTTGEKVHLLTSGTCWQFAPLLWEQPYIEEVELEDTKAHSIVPIDRGAIFPHWQWYAEGDGLNLSLQPSYFRDAAPISWTRCYMEAAGITELLPEDLVALPTLVNHHRWMSGITVANDGVPQERTNTFIVAPEVESLASIEWGIWRQIINALIPVGHVILVGVHRYPKMTFTVWPLAGDRFTDMRGLTTVPTLATLIAEAHGFIGAHSFPWHLARHSGVLSVCLQSWREGLRRCLPVDTDYLWMEPNDWPKAVEMLTKETEVAV